MRKNESNEKCIETDKSMQTDDSNSKHSALGIFNEIKKLGTIAANLPYSDVYTLEKSSQWLWITMMHFESRIDFPQYFLH